MQSLGNAALCPPGFQASVLLPWGSLPSTPSNVKTPVAPLELRCTRMSTSSDECFLFVDTQRCLLLLNASAEPTRIHLWQSQQAVCKGEELARCGRHGDQGDS